MAIYARLENGTYAEVTGVYKADGTEVTEIFQGDRLVYSATNEIYGTLPLYYSGRGFELIDYLISGNAVQDGTPSSDAPVDAVGSGVRTGNLFPLDAAKLHVGRIENDGTIDYEIGTITVGTNSVTYQANAIWRGFYTDYIRANENEKLTFSQNDIASISCNCNCYDENDNFLGKAPAQSTAQIKTFTTLAGTKKVRISVTSSFNEYTIANPMLNLGSTALPYEPYGFKLPLTVNDTEYPIYLGTVPTTRRIKKLVLTGEENYTEYSFSGTLGVYVSDVLDTKYTREMGICSHYPVSTSVTVNTLWIGVNDTRLYFVGIRDALGVETAAEVKAWVTQQYANGTPVTVWYVLAEPETAIVNEPLMKIGDYADTVSFAQAGVTIPTVNGANVLDMASPVKPSEIYIKGKGIKQNRGQS